ncbi:hypothetical protein GCM10023311_23860 [Flaviramulus aquimarinus]|uniref:Transposase IS110-like N-terminal domain-containing protein n=1 Tax=Flaviramulus aquimarinus TaxID=1170456 RepID=A0ABP9FCA4_9FLAO
MNKYSEIYGLDISKDVFDVYGSESGHNQFKNDEKGFNVFLKSLPKEALVVMEATGYYHYRLAQFLFKSSVLVSVVNPLSVKRFIQMKLAKVKTDKSDAKAICEYGQMNDVPLYTALNEVQSECLQLFRLLDSYLKQRTASKNKLHGEETLGIPSKFVYRSLKRNVKHLQKEIAAIEGRLLDLVKQDQQHQLALIAVANKLLKQAFAIAKSGRPYDENFVSRLA